MLSIGLLMVPVAIIGITSTVSAYKLGQYSRMGTTYNRNIRHTNSSYNSYGLKAFFELQRDRPIPTLSVDFKYNAHRSNIVPRLYQPFYRSTNIPIHIPSSLVQTKHAHHAPNNSNRPIPLPGSTRKPSSDGLAVDGGLSKLRQLPTDMQQAIICIADDIRIRRSWNSNVGDMVPHIITQLPSWPPNKYLKIITDSGAVMYDSCQGSVADGKTPVTLQLKDGHYTPIINGQPVQVASDGDCFYHSLLLSLNGAEQRQLIGSDFKKHARNSCMDDRANPNVTALRSTMADQLFQHSEIVTKCMRDLCYQPKDFIQTTS